MLAMLAGCTRSHYRLRADADTYSILNDKAGCSPWAPPSDFSIEPHPASRFYDPTPTDDPWLPVPSPQLYAYKLPELRPAETSRFQGAEPGYDNEPLSDPVVTAPRAPLPFFRLPPVSGDETSVSPEPADAIRATRASYIARASFESNTVLRRRRIQEGDVGADSTYAAETTIVPIPASAWENIPLSCRRRMHDFERIRREYELTYGRTMDESEVDPAPRLTLEDIIDLVSINSRDYQSQKELLYQVALNLSLQRFAYDLKFSAGGNGTSPDFTHNRTGGITENTLRLPTTLQADKMLLTGGDLLARFANDVVLTFNGPTGFAADVGSSLFFDLSQSILQRDIRLEALTQSERDVVYAARNFARFRKELFTDLATRYYNLLLTYRQVEIDSQNYVALARFFNQTEAEYRNGIIPRFQVAQVEQDLLNGRRRLIGTCNNLERSLDDLKVSIGLPTESRVNVNLRELERLTLRDELAVASELINRESDRLRADRNEEQPSRFVLLPAAVEVVNRILEAFDFQERQGQQPGDRGQLQDTRLLMLLESVREDSRQVRQDLEVSLRRREDIKQEIQKSLNLVDILIELIGRQIGLAEHRSAAPPELDELRRQQMEIAAQTDRVRELFLSVFQEEAELPAVMEQTRELLRQAESIVQTADQAAGRPSVSPAPEIVMRETLQAVDELLAYAETVRNGIGSGLVPVEIEVDDAMMTALVLRFDLMNERGILADDWRQIKLAGDDLRSVLDLNASQTIRTRADVNRAFDFTLDESETRLRLTFDAPFNRRSQRNSYRRALINYNAGLRSLMLLEDNVKLAVRNDLRGLVLTQEQYPIDVAGAALLSKQVTSTTLEFRMGFGIVRATDILEAQNDYASALSRVAQARIDYIIGRMQLFLDLELMTVGNDGFWQELYDEAFQPEPYYQLPPEAMPAYGGLPHLLYSKKIRRMEQVPVGVSTVHGGDEADFAPLGVPPLPEAPEPVVY
jgi:outer membrane protein TolC